MSATVDVSIPQDIVDTLMEFMNCNAPTLPQLVLTTMTIGGSVICDLIDNHGEEDNGQHQMIQRLAESFAALDGGHTGDLLGYLHERMPAFTIPIPTEVPQPVIEGAETSNSALLSFAQQTQAAAHALFTPPQLTVPSPFQLQPVEPVGPAAPTTVPQQPETKGEEIEHLDPFHLPIVVNEESTVNGGGGGGEQIETIDTRELSDVDVELEQS